jgi:hypothetical protein
MRALAKHLGIPFEPRLIERKPSKKVSGGKSGFRPELSNCAGLVVTKRGSAANGGGTWLHPKLAVAFARWLSPEFAVWCDLQIDALIHGDVQAQQQFDRSCKALAAGQQRASLSGKQMAEWRWSKPSLEQQVEHWRSQLQMTLALDAV